MALISDAQLRAIARRFAHLMRPLGNELPPPEWPEEAWRSALAMDWVKFVRAVGPCISGPMRPANPAQWRIFCEYLDGWRRSFSRYIPHADELKQAGQPALRLRLDQILQQLEDTARITHPSATPPRPVRAVVPGSKLPPLASGGASKPAPATPVRVRAAVPGSKLMPAPGAVSKPATATPRMQAPQPAPVSRPPPPAAPARPVAQPSKVDAEIAAYLAKAEAEIRALQSGTRQSQIDAGQKALATMTAHAEKMDAVTTASHAKLAAHMDRRSDAEWIWRLQWGRKPLRNRW
jgi:hypothetical protein